MARVGVGGCWTKLKDITELKFSYLSLSYNKTLTYAIFVIQQDINICRQPNQFAVVTGNCFCLVVKEVRVFDLRGIEWYWGVLRSQLLSQTFCPRHPFVIVKLMWSRNRPGLAQRVGRGIALLFHDRGTRKGWVVSSTPRPHFTPGKDPVLIVQEAGRAPGPVWTGGKSRPHRDSISDHPDRS